MAPKETIRSTRERIEEGTVSLPGRVEQYLQKIREKNGEWNVFVEVFDEEARREAKRVEEAIHSGSAGKLAGLVIGIKDNIGYKGHPVSAASNMLEGFVSTYHATVVQRLLDEDAIIIGSLNCDEFAMGGSNENSRFGPAKNPIDPEKVPGGSSGGSAAAVKAGLCDAALGSDTGGSIRQPASYCDVIGFKPTYGRVSRYGLIAYASSFDQIGPLTHNIPDAALILEVIAGRDEYDNTASGREVPLYSGKLRENGQKKIAYIRECLEQEGIDPEIRDRTRELLDHLKEEGHEVEEVSFPYLEQLVPTYQVLSTAEASSNLARYDGVHYGYRHPDAQGMEEVYTLSRSHGFGEEVKRRIMLGTFVLSSGYYDAYYAKGQKVRRLIREWTENTLKEYDMIALPTTPTTPFAIGEKIDDPVTMYLQDIFTVHANLAGIPAISIPAGRHSNGLPFGFQLMAGGFKEEDLFTFAHHLINNGKLITS